MKLTDVYNQTMKQHLVQITGVLYNELFVFQMKESMQLAGLSVYSLNKPRPESLTLLQILADASGDRKMKKSKLIDKLEEANLVDKNLSSAAKHSRLKALLHPITIGGGIDNPLVEVEYGGRQSNVKLTSQGESTLRIFGGE